VRKIFESGQDHSYKKTKTELPRQAIKMSICTGRKLPTRTGSSSYYSLLIWMMLASVALEVGRCTATTNRATTRSRRWQETLPQTLLDQTHPQGQQGNHRHDKELSTQEKEKEEEDVGQSQSESSLPRRLLNQHSSSSKQPWLQEHFPRPDSADCRSSKSHRICDPDGVLSSAGMAKIDEYLDHKKIVHKALCKPNTATGGDSNDREKVEGFEIQMAVVLVNEVGRLDSFLRCL
jgi:hypothetical protein